MNGARIVEGAAISDMTLKDWFAGQALAGMYANSILIQNLDDQCRRDGGDTYDLIRFMAYASYQRADAMLAEKRRRESQE